MTGAILIPDNTARNIERLSEQLENVAMPPMLAMRKMEALRVLAAPYDLALSDETARKTVDFATDALKSRELTTGEDMRDALGILKRAYVHLAPRDFHSFLMALEWEREPSKAFYRPRMSVMRPVVDELTKLMATDELDILSLSMPPGVGKSTLGIMFLCWVIGHDPLKPNLASGYSDKITRSFYTGVYGIATDPEYMLAEIYPRLQLIQTNAKDETLDFRDDGRQAIKRFASLTCRSIDGSLTGATRCEGILYCDDLVSGIEEAMNINRMDALWSKYGTDLKTRKKKGCKELHIGTRWSLHDPIGRLERMNEGNPRSRFISLPAVDDAGHSHFDYLYNVGFDDHYFNEMRDTVDEVSWLCVYMQTPVEREGLLFPSSELRRFLSLPPRVEPDEIFAFVDVAFGGSDSLSMPIIHRYDNEYYVVGWIHDKGDYKVTEPRVAAAIEHHGIQRVRFEANNGGEFYARDIMDILKERNVACSVTAERAPNDKSKLARIIQHSPATREFLFWDNSVYPDDDYRRAMNELTSFTQTGKNRHDDAPDALTGGAMMVRGRGTASIRVMDRKTVGF